MVPVDRFDTLPVQRQPELQVDSPVYVHCSRRCVDRTTGAVFLQVRLVNRAPRSTVRTVLLRAEGLDGEGTCCYAAGQLILTECDAAPWSIFGEHKLLALPHQAVERVRLTVEQVAFSDGMTWRMQPEQTLLTEEEAGWTTCPCGMRHPAEEVGCCLCGRGMEAEEGERNVSSQAMNSGAAPETQTAPGSELVSQMLAKLLADPEAPEEGELPVEAAERPAPVTRVFYDEDEENDWDDEEEEEQEAPGWLVALLCTLGVVALVAVMAFLAYCFLLYTGKI